MAFVWVQHYLPLPVIFEDPGMGDDSQLPHFPLEQPQIRQRDHSPQALGHSTAQQTGQQNMEFESYVQQPFPMGHHGGGATMDMRSFAAALPDYHVRQYPQQSFQHQFHSQGNSNHNLVPQYQQGAQFAGQAAANGNPNLGQPFPSHYLQQQAGRPQQTHFVNYSGAQGPSHSFSGQNLQLQQEFGHNQAHHYLQMSSGQYGSGYPGRINTGFQHPQLRPSGNVPINSTMTFQQQLTPQPIRRSSSNSSLQTSTIRGPPRKPKQSGHALWVGNLPPGTHIVDLKDHFAREADKDIESVFLISKSNCAFVNYKSESSCTAAMSRFHDSRFQGVRLVCRLRRGSASVANSAQVTPPIAASPSAPAPAPSSRDSSPEGAAMDEAATTEEVPANDTEPEEKVKEKFFVVKSLTIEDLERSVQTGVWATQAHNEDSLNKAYQTAESVYLIFSANKSGEYYGYARMDSAIDEEAAAKIETPSRPQSSDPVVTDLPLTIPTPATATAPKGRIIDDSSRGTIFWEADSEEKEEQKDDDTGNNSGYESAASAGPSPATSQTFGKPFKIVWISTERLPFYRTRGLRNPWNANREVKIARDGTEIEPSVGRRLTGMFHRPHIAATSPASRQPPGVMGVPTGFITHAGNISGLPYGRTY